MATVTSLPKETKPIPLPLIPPSVCLLGASGAGKTDCIATLIEAGLEVFHAGTEPGACEVLVDSVKRRGLDMNKLHFHQMRPTPPSLDVLIDTAATVNALTYEKLTALTDIRKREMTAYMDLLLLMKNFHDHRTGKLFGDVTEWKDDRAIIIDTLSGVNKMTKEYVVGYKPTMSPGDWNVSMNMEENLIYTLISNRSCFFVLCAHIDREVDEVFGGTKLTIAALGRKLAPQLVKYFSEIIYAKRNGNDFSWSTSESTIDVKNRLLPINQKLLPSFVPIVRGYKARLESLNAA